MSNKPVFMLLTHDYTDDDGGTDSVHNGQTNSKAETAKDNEC
jgi:hypothetical protein